MSHLELHLKGLRFKGEKPWDDSEDCQRSGLSVHSSRDAAERKRKSSGGMRRFKIAEGEVKGVGLIADTSSDKGEDHYTWWFEDEVDPVPLFKVFG
jgi:hypothetical protein